jgi:hypothetical protein
MHVHSRPPPPPTPTPHPPPCLALLLSWPQIFDKRAVESMDSMAKIYVEARKVLAAMKGVDLK